MKKVYVGALAAFLLTPLLALPQSGQFSVVADVPFAFHIGNEVLQAGTYAFRPGTSTGVLNVTHQSSGKTTMANVITRLSQRSENYPEIVFDKVGDQHYLAELHSPHEDGFHLQGAPGPHTHVSVKGKR